VKQTGGLQDREAAGQNARLVSYGCWRGPRLTASAFLNSYSIRVSVTNTERLRLIPASPETLEAELEGPVSLGRVLGVAVPANWPPELYDSDATSFTLGRLRDHPEEQGWWLYYFAESNAAGEQVVGCGGFKGPPASGVVEIGYSVLDQFRRRGYASEATEALCRRAFGTPGVSAVAAETLPELVPSTGVLNRCGFTLIGEGSEPGVIRFELTKRKWLESQGVSAPLDG
jgi:ribosomal-protein-alanine N-acetyltransferase